MGIKGHPESFDMQVVKIICGAFDESIVYT